MKLTLFLFTFLFAISTYCQNFDKKIVNIEKKIDNYDHLIDSLEAVLEEVKLKKNQAEIILKCLPKLEENEELIKHVAMCLVYSEKHEQAKWVAHIITPDIAKGRISRTNDFRPDSLIKTGSAVEADYFLKYLQPDNTYKYEGFGYDRGHLAPSADFRWSEKALSESYFYSNMSPQLGDFNREKWAELENMLRTYVFQNGVSLFIVTGPVLSDDLPVIEKGVNKVSIPKMFFKIAVDPVNKRGIAFLMQNEKLEAPVEVYSKKIDEIEQLTGIDFFPNLDDELENNVESQKNVQDWLPEKQKNDVLPIPQKKLQKNQYNTIFITQFVDTKKKVEVCGTVVSVHKSKKGNIFINLDKAFPKQVFTVSIFKKNLINFSYDPEIELKGKKVSFKGFVTEYNGVPSMIIENEKKISILNNVAD